MKKILLGVAVIALVVIFSAPSYSAIKCIRKSDGSTCCWDTETEGPYKPISCM